MRNLTIEGVLNDTYNTSQWFQNALRTGLDRDCLDFLREATLLLQLAQQNADQAMGRIGSSILQDKF